MEKHGCLNLSLVTSGIEIARIYDYDARNNPTLPGLTEVADGFEFHCLSGPILASFRYQPITCALAEGALHAMVFFRQIFVRWEEPLTDQSKGSKRNTVAATV